MTDLTSRVQHFTSRYQAAALAKVSILGALSLAICILLTLRLRAMAVSPPWAIGIPLGVGLVAAAGLAVWLKRRWISRQASAAFLDRTLGLEERLTTAMEFDRAKEPPALFPLLAADAAARCTTSHVQFPRPVDRLAGVLVLLLLMLWLPPWPGGGLLQLVRETAAPFKEPQSSKTSGEGSGETGSAGQGESAESGHEETGPSSRGDQSPSTEGQGKEQGSQARGPSSQQQDQAGAGGHEAERDTASGAHGAGQPSREQNAEAGSASTMEREQQRERTAKSSSDSQHASPRTGQASQQTGRMQGANELAAAGDPSEHQGEASGAGDEALRADIQELLQELSGELQNLQMELASARTDTRPTIGNQTDPELYGSQGFEPITPKDFVPIQLETDASPTERTRPGGGVGEASGEISAQGPRATLEAAALSQTPIAERAGSRQPIPPEYRGVFERLQTPRATDAQAGP